MHDQGVYRTKEADSLVMFRESRTKETDSLVMIRESRTKQNDSLVMITVKRTKETYSLVLRTRRLISCPHHCAKNQGDGLPCLENQKTDFLSSSLCQEPRRLTP
jgi:hypothetical protein